MLEVLAELPILSQHAPHLRGKLQEELDVSCSVQGGCISAAYSSIMNLPPAR